MRRADVIFTAQTENKDIYFSLLNNYMTYSAHDHAYYEIDVVLRPAFTYILNGASLRPKRGDVFLLRPFQDVHEARRDSPDVPVLVRDFFAMPELFAEVCGFLSPTLLDEIAALPDALHFVLTEEELQYIEEVFSGPWYYPAKKDRERVAERIEAKKKAALTYLLNAYLHQQLLQSLPGRKIAPELMEWLRMDEFRRLSVEEMGERLHYSPDYLEKEFKRVFGMSIKQYQMNRRYAQAAELLIKTDMSVPQIMKECGWRDSGNFYRAFRKHFGMDPKEYRRTHRT